MSLWAFYYVSISGGAGQKVLQSSGGSQQVIRIPASSTSSTSSVGNVSVGQLQKIQIGNKIQYVRVIPSGGSKAAPQTTTVRQTQPILPSTTKGGSSTSSQVSLKAIPSTGNQQVVKIALPSNFQQQAGVSIYISKYLYYLRKWNHDINLWISLKVTLSFI